MIERRAQAPRMARSMLPHEAARRYVTADTICRDSNRGVCCSRCLFAQQIYLATRASRLSFMFFVRSSPPHILRFRRRSSLLMRMPVDIL